MDSLLFISLKRSQEEEKRWTNGAAVEGRGICTKAEAAPSRRRVRVESESFGSDRNMRLEDQVGQEYRLPSNSDIHSREGMSMKRL